MKEMYQSPEFKVVKFDLEGRIMGDYTGGDILEDPWQEEASATDTLVLE